MSAVDGTLFIGNVPLDGATTTVSQSTSGGQSVGTNLIFTNIDGDQVRIYMASRAESSTLVLYIQTLSGVFWETQTTIDTLVVPGG